MDPIQQCHEILQRLIAEANDNGVGPAEQAIERLLAPLGSNKVRSDLIFRLQEDLGGIAKPVSKKQIDFLNLVLDFLEKRQRELQ
jgi:hypothetical protein